MEYQLAFLASPLLNQPETEDFLKKLESLIQKGGEIIRRENLKKLRLWYPIKKQKEAYFGSFDFSGTPGSAMELDSELKKEKNILRFLIIKKEIKEKERVKRTKKTAVSETTQEEIDKKPKEDKVELEGLEEKINNLV